MRRQVTVTVLAMLMLGGAAPLSQAAEADGCAGQATSYAEDGATLGTALAPGEGGTRQDPLPVDWNGPIAWSGTTDVVLRDGTTTVVLAPANGGVVIGGLLEVASGQALGGPFANTEGDAGREGSTTPADYSLGIPLLTGTYSVDLTMTAAAGSCTGAGFLTIIDPPVTSLLWWVAAALVVVGLLLALFARPTARAASDGVIAVRRRPVRGLLAGLLVGLGAGVMMMLYDVALSSDLAIAAGVALGVVWGLAGPTRRRARARGGGRREST